MKVGASILGILIAGCTSVPLELQRALAGYPELRITEVDNTIVVQGESDEPFRAWAVEAILNDLNAQGNGETRFVSRITLTRQARARLAKQITDKIGVKGITTHFIGETLFLEGISPNDYEADRAVEIAKSMLILPQPISAGRDPAGNTARLIDILRVVPKRK